MKLLRIMSVDFEVTHKLLIRTFGFVRYWRKNGSTMAQYSNYSQSSRNHSIQLGGKYSTIF
jgi:hypothetical protein